MKKQNKNWPPPKLKSAAMRYRKNCLRVGLYIFVLIAAFVAALILFHNYIPLEVYLLLFLALVIFVTASLFRNQLIEIFWNEEKTVLTVSYCNLLGPPVTEKFMFDFVRSIKEGRYSKHITIECYDLRQIKLYYTGLKNFRPKDWLYRYDGEDSYSY